MHPFISFRQVKAARLIKCFTSECKAAAFEMACSLIASD